MSFVDGAEDDYPRTMTFGAEQFLEVTPDHMAHWMKKMVYGTPTPNPEDRPNCCRSTTREQAKKAIYFVMPNKHMAWAVRINSGNPSKYMAVIDVISAVRKGAHRKQNTV
jgi:hypothetical protein